MRFNPDRSSASSHLQRGKAGLLRVFSPLSMDTELEARTPRWAPAAAAAVLGHEALVERREAVHDGLERVFCGKDGGAGKASG